MNRRIWRAGALAMVGLAVLTLGCLDSVVRTLAPENDPQVVNTPNSFQFTATDLENVTDDTTWVWTNTAPQATLHHNSFIHHGYGILVIRDAAGVVVDSTLLEREPLVTDTKVGTAGDWTINLTLAGARGRVDFVLTPKP
jgi:hypothetical protein